MSLWTLELIGLGIVFALSIGPGAGLAYVIASRLEWGRAAWLAASFAFSMAMVTAIALAGNLLGFDIKMAAVAIVLLAAASAAAGALLKGRRRGRLLADWDGLGIAAAAGALAYWERPWFEFTADTFYHLAAARSLLARGETLVTDPMHNTAASVLDPTSGTWHTLIAIASGLSDGDAAVLFLGATAIGAAMVALAFWALARRVSGTGWAASVATLAFLGLARFADFRMDGYPHTVSLAMVFVAMLALASLVETRGADAWVAAFLAGFGAVGAHLGSAILVFAAAGMLGVWLLVVAAFSRATVRRELFVAILLLVALLGVLGASSLPLVLPRAAGAAQIQAGGSGVTAAAADMDPETYLRVFGDGYIYRPGALNGGGPIVFIAVLVAAAALGLRAFKGDTREVAPLAYITMPAILLVNPLVTPFLIGYSRYMTNRIGTLLAFAPFLALAWALAQASSGRTSRARVALPAVAAAILLAHAAVSYPATFATFETPKGAAPKGRAYPVAESRRTDVRGSWGGALIAARGVFGEEYPLVAAMPETGYYLAGLAPVPVVATLPSHSPFAVETTDGPQRRADMEELFRPKTSSARRREILAKYGARYVAAWTANDEDAAGLPSMQRDASLFDVVVEGNRLVVLRVRD